jgi:hypothetical protein
VLNVCGILETLCEPDEFPPTAVGFDTTSLDVCDSAFSLPVVLFDVSTGVVLSAGQVSLVCIDMQPVASATIAYYARPSRRGRPGNTAALKLLLIQLFGLTE